MARSVRDVDSDWSPAPGCNLEVQVTPPTPEVIGLNTNQFAQFGAKPPMSSQRRLVERIVLLLATAGITASITATFLKMRENMTAADGGGPGLSVAVVCTILFTFLSMRGSVKLRVPGLASYAWPAFFLALSWNFFELGFNPADQDGTVGTRIFLGVLTAAIGLIPLLIRLWFKRAVKDARSRMESLFARGGPGVRVVNVDVVDDPPSSPPAPHQHRVIEAEEDKA